MADPISTTLSVPFTDDTSGLQGANIEMDLDPGFTAFGQFRVRHFPAVNAKIVADIGTVVKQGTSQLSIPREAVRISGKTASANFPITQLLSVSTPGTVFDRDGNSISPGFVHDGFGIATADGTDAFGMLIIEYTANFLQLLYTGQIIGTTVKLGSILSFFEGSVAVFDIPLPEFDTEGEHFEIYRIVSEMVVNEDGQFEKPEGWIPGDDTSPTFPGGNPDPTLPSIVVERVHEVGHVTNPADPLTRTRRRCFRVEPEEPFAGGGFTPPKTLKIAQPSADGPTSEQMNHPNVQQAINSAQART